MAMTLFDLFDTPVSGFTLINSEPVMTSTSFQLFSDLLVLFGSNKPKTIPGLVWVRVVALKIELGDH